MIIYENILEEDYKVLTDIMTRAFDDDTRMHTNLQADGPRGYNDGSLLRKLNENIKYISRKIILDGVIVGGYTVEIAENHAELIMLFLDPEIKNMGIGLAVWNDIEKTFNKVERWIVETPSYSQRNISFYTKKCGFIFIEEKVYGDEEKSVIMEKIMR